MTPAERLLAAADLLDKRASEATEGPWEAGARIVWTTAPADASSHDGIVIGDGEPEWTGGCGRPEDARYIATMHPEVGKALAAWLRHEGQGAAAGLGVLNPTLRLADLVLAGGEQS